MKYELLEHTADMKFRAYGSSLEEAFVNAALATFSILINPEEVRKELKHNINITSKSKQSLLYDFLDELLFLLDTQGFLLNNINSLTIFSRNNEFNLSCIALGDSFKNYSISGNVKSVTYNDMEINDNFSKQKNKKIMLQVVLDI